MYLRILSNFVFHMVVLFHGPHKILFNYIVHYFQNSWAEQASVFSFYLNYTTDGLLKIVNGFVEVQCESGRIGHSFTLLTEKYAFSYLYGSEGIALVLYWVGAVNNSGL